MVLGNTCFEAREVLLDILHRNVRARRNGSKHALVPTRQGVLMAAAAAAAVAASVAAADASVAAADVARRAAKLTAAADGAADGVCRSAYQSLDTASTVLWSPAAATLAVASRLYTCGQGMSAAGTFVPRP